jgi:hypothetical protein
MNVLVFLMVLLSALAVVVSLAQSFYRLVAPFSLGSPLYDRLSLIGSVWMMCLATLSMAFVLQTVVDHSRAFHLAQLGAGILVGGWTCFFVIQTLLRRKLANKWTFSVAGLLILQMAFGWSHARQRLEPVPLSFEAVLMSYPLEAVTEISAQPRDQEHKREPLSVEIKEAIPQIEPQIKSQIKPQIKIQAKAASNKKIEKKVIPQASAVTIVAETPAPQTVVSPQPEPSLKDKLQRPLWDTGRFGF